MPLDVVLGESGLECGFLSRARPLDLGGVVVPVISPEDLVVTKVLAGRPKDLDDVRGILRERAATLDLGSIRRLLGELEDALATSELRPTFEELLRGR